MCLSQSDVSLAPLQEHDRDSSRRPWEERRKQYLNQAENLRPESKWLSVVAAVVFILQRDYSGAEAYLQASLEQTDLPDEAKTRLRIVLWTIQDVFDVWEWDSEYNKARARLDIAGKRQLVDFAILQSFRAGDFQKANGFFRDFYENYPEEDGETWVFFKLVQWKCCTELNRVSTAEGAEKKAQEELAARYLQGARYIASKITICSAAIRELLR
jgi:tetratricopeptide (TPR) repeat protein